MAFVRVPAGNGRRSGEFAVHAHGEPRAQLGAPSDVEAERRVSELRESAQKIADRLGAQAAGKGLDEHRGILAVATASRPDDESRLIEAEFWAQAMGDSGNDPDEDLLAEIEDRSPELLMDADPEDYESWNEPDRPGENGYSGINWFELGLDVGDRWSAEADRVARRMVARTERSAA